MCCSFGRDLTMPPNHHHQNFVINTMPMEPISRTYQYRKVMKPMLERKRRARINKCLDELKELMTGALQSEGENVCKLEKADILELTVKHLHKLRETNTLFIGSQHHPPANNTTPQVHVGKFWEGFNLCAGEVSQFLTKYDRKISQNLFRYIMGGYPNISHHPPPPSESDGWMAGRRHAAAPDEESSVWRPW
ncbi:hypothetical protein ACFFRR_002465 [Megaselia abdita]